MHKMLQDRRFQLILTIGLAVFCRGLVLVLFPSAGDPDAMDTESYNMIAFQLMEGKGFALYDDPTVYVAPLLPFFLAGVYSVFGIHFWVVNLLFILFAAISTYLVYKIARLRYSFQTGLTAALLFAIEPSLCGITAFIYTEPLNIPLLLGSMYFLLYGFKSNKRHSFLVSGFFMGLSTLCKGTTLLFPFVLTVILFLSPKTRYRWKQLFLFVSTFCVVLVPWTVRNYQTFHVFLPVATGAGESLWTGNYFPFDGEFRYGKTQKKASELTEGLSWLERDRKLGEEARKMIFNNPGKFVKLSMKKIYRYGIKVYEGIPTGQKRSRELYIVVILAASHWLLLILSGAGVVIDKNRDVMFWTIIILLLYYLGIHVITFAIPRYRIPVVPFILPFAALSIQKVWENRIKRRMKRTEASTQ